MTPDEYVILLSRRILVRVPRRVQVVAPRAEAVRVAHVEHQCHRKLIGFLWREDAVKGWSENLVVRFTLAIAEWETVDSTSERGAERAERVSASSED